VPQVSQQASDLQKQKHVDSAGYLSNKTIAALCTPTGGAITVLRLSGSNAIKIAEKLSSFKIDLNAERRAKRVWLSDQNKKIDDAVMVPYFGPRSFTGEDVVEFFLHGSPIIAQKVLDLIFAEGARLALPGEFSFRAVKNGKMQLSQAEAIKELIAAENDFALDLALEKLSGSQHELIEKIRTDLMQLATLSEVGIDFSDQDIDEVSLPRLRGRLGQIISMLENLGGSFDRGKRFTDGIPVSLFGLPNAGKSSFFNALLGEDRSIVSDIAGTTRDVVREKLNLKGLKGYVTYKLSDTAGLRGLKVVQDADKIEQIGIQKTIQTASSSDLVLIVVDGLSPNLEEVESFLQSIQGKKTIGIITKKDLVDDASQEEIKLFLLSKLSEVKSWTWISSTTLEGVSDVAKEMAIIAEDILIRKPGEVVITQVEHLQAIERSLKCLKEANDCADLVLFATTVRHGMGELGALIGETLPDDVLGKIFSDFCIGK
jgi:tRNA modification GTPase